MRTTPAPLTPEISLAMLTAGRADFAAHYSVQGNQNFAPDIIVKWDELRKAVEDSGGINNVKNIILKLIHMYDGSQWYLTMEVCELGANGSLSANGNRFTLKNNTPVETSDFKDNYDPAYFANVLCDNQAISPDRYVNYVTFPWYQEIQEMHCQNNLPDDDPTLMVKFAACTYDYTAYIPGTMLVPFPHIIVILFSDAQHGEYVDNITYQEMFKEKAADLGGVCPPACNCYEWPASLPKDTKCLP